MKKKFILVLFSLFIFFVLIYNVILTKQKNMIRKDLYNIEKIKNNNFKKNLATTIVIGSGPAGCAAALYCARMGGNVVVLSGRKYGGQLMTTSLVENWPGVVGLQGPAIMQISKNQAESYGAIFLDQDVLSIDTSSWPFKVILDDERFFYTFSIVLATGSNHKSLGCKGESEYWAKGVSTCAICDGPIYKDKNVIIVGGGDSACEEALQLAAHAKSIKMLIRGPKMRASSSMRKRVEDSKKIEIIYNIQIKEIKGNEKKVTEVLCEKESGEKINLETAAVFIAIGHTPNISLVKDIVELDENGLILCQGRSQKTSFPGIFAAGDVANNYRQAGIASGEGIKAALDIYQFLQENFINDVFILKNNDIWITKKSLAVEVAEKEAQKDVVCKDGVCYLVQPLNQPELNENVDKIEKAVETVLKEEEKSLKKTNFVKDVSSLNEFNGLYKEYKNQYYLLDLYTTNCPACKKIKSSFSEYVKLDNSIPVFTVNIGNIYQVQDLFDINSVPTIVLMYGNKEVSRKIGYMDAKELIKWIKKYISK
jgi:thioredoxin reductase (NADPH)